MTSAGHSTSRRVATLFGLACGCAAALAVSAGVGAVGYSAGAVARAVLHPFGSSTAEQVLWLLRFPRVLIAALVGASLALAGALLQGMLRNPLVDPYLTGASAGAACAVAIALVLGFALPALPLVAFAAALVTAAFVAALARTGSGISAERLILAGISLSALFAGVVTLVLVMAPPSSTSVGILAWLGGSVAGRGWHELAWAALYAAVGAAVAFGLAPSLNALRLGDERARALGIDVDRAHWGILGSAALLTAAAVSVSGMVGFVGLIVPHVARRMVGSDARWMLPACALTGAILVVAADALARGLVPPLELPLGVLLSLLGVPAFLYLAFYRRTP
ncbi:MAG TPA: iron ABC transporter permease [Candidatus Dormibacteraeota bacterium]|nr:iron ABC transporter permease [Candidatus Dormibacteraeota bacterium]